MRTEYGTSYKRLPGQGAEKSALVETVHASFFEEYRENLEQMVDIASVDYLIYEPHRARSLRLYRPAGRAQPQSDPS